MLHGDERARGRRRRRARSAPRPRRTGTPSTWRWRWRSASSTRRAEAIEHINAHGSGHSEAIVTRVHRLGARVPARRRRGLRVRQRLDALHRRGRVRDGRRDRQLDPEAPRPRPDRPARAVHVQVPGRGRRARPSLSRRFLDGCAHRDPRRDLQPATSWSPRLRPGGVPSARARPRDADPCPDTAAQARRRRAGPRAPARAVPARGRGRRAVRGRPTWRWPGRPVVHGRYP